MTLQLTDTCSDMAPIVCVTLAARKVPLAGALLLMALGLSLWPGGAAAQFGAYKCYVIAEDGAPHLRLLESQDLQRAHRAAARPLKLTKTRVTKIMQVVECQPQDTSFVDPAARLLDERTPR